MVLPQTEVEKKAELIRRYDVVLFRRPNVGSIMIRAVG